MMFVACCSSEASLHYVTGCMALGRLMLTYAAVQTQRAQFKQLARGNAIVSMEATAQARMIPTETARYLMECMASIM